jgi:multidrug efflux pump subunit AcrA (membrane-fusion protein)
MRGLASTAAVGVVLVVVLVLIAAWLIRQSAGSIAPTSRNDVFEVRRGSFDIMVPASGELAALNQIEIKNELDTRAVITEVVGEGVRVEPGDILIKFNDDTIREEIKDEEDDVEEARNDHLNAEAALEILMKKQESELAASALAIRLAELALKSWQEGTFVTKTKENELAVETAEKECERLRERFAAAERLLAQDFIALDEYKQDEIALLRAESSLETATLGRDIYIEYDAVRDLETLESDLTQARDEAERTTARLIAEVRSANSDLVQRKNRLDSRQERLEKWKQQLELCEIRSPSAGLVVYASSLRSGHWGRGRDDDPPQVGTEVYPNQTIMVIPDISEMVAAVKVNEAQMGMIEAGQEASIVSDALPEVIMTGEVLTIGVLAEGGSWRDPNRRDYTVRVLLREENDLGLKPSMRCKAQITVGSVDDTLFVPIQSVRREGRHSFVYATADGGYAQKPVRVGRASELFVEVLEGIDEGADVLLREPVASEVVERIAGDDRKAGGGPPRGGKGRGGGERRRPAGASSGPG